LNADALFCLFCLDIQEQQFSSDDFNVISVKLAWQNDDMIEAVEN
jgi:hypothetical protein